MSERDDTGRINGWTCDTCGEVTYVVHVDSGVTPFYLACRAEGVDPAQAQCKGTGKSMFYPEGPPPLYVIYAVAWEWYTPDEHELQEMESSMREHIKKGGVDLRPLTDAGRALLEDLT